MSFPYPFFQIQCKVDGTLFLQSEVDALMAGIAASSHAPTDLFVLSHGWNNDLTYATELYTSLIAVIKPQLDANPVLARRSYAICGIFWPSIQFDDKDLIPGGAAALNDAVTIDHLKARVRDLGNLTAATEWAGGSTTPPAGFAELESLMDAIEDNPAAQLRAVDLLRSMLPAGNATSDDGSDHFLTIKNTTLVTRLSKPLNPPVAVPGGSGAASIDPFSTETVSGLGGAAGFRDVLGGIRSGFLNALNYSTYYVMKGRAGDVGVKSLVPLLIRLRTSRPDLRIHMIGHSFGCRLVSSAVNSLPDGEQFRPDTVMLLQGAFSHNGFAKEGDNTDRGVFRDVIEKRKVRGPILISHTRRDKAVGIAYPIASRLSGVNAAALGDANDIYGGLGSNGTQTKITTPEGNAGTMLKVGETYRFAAGVAPSTPCNLNADAFISGHSDICKPEVGYALSVGMTAKMS
jgi:hypothetical protein